jgi:hypothetical protein
MTRPDFDDRDGHAARTARTTLPRPHTLLHPTRATEDQLPAHCGRSDRCEGAA